MRVKHTFLLLILLLITACSQTETIQPTNTLPDPTATLLPPTPQPTDTVSTGDSYDASWDDRTFFSANLTASAQDILNQLPFASYYRIDLNITGDMILPAEGHLEVRYFNQENRSLNEIIFRLFANYNGGAITVSNVFVNQVPVQPTLEAAETTMVVPLSEPLPVNQSVIISMDFSLTIPTTPGGNYGLFSYSDNVLVMDLFYPMIPAYDSTGWYREYPAPSGDLSYNDMSFYLVNVSAPESMALVASGSMIARSTSDGRQQVTFAAGPVRDFYLAGSNQFSVISTQVGETTINSYALPGYEVNQQLVLDYLARGMNFFSSIYGSYPYSEFDAISSPMNALGIEYPGVVGILKDLYIPGGNSYNFANEDLLETVVIHELAHQWFYNLVGNDQQDLPWLDESITQYSVFLYMQAVHGESSANERLNEWYSRWEQLDYAEVPIGLRVRDYAKEAYSPVIYGRGPLFFYQLADRIGQDTVVNALASYFRQYQWSIGTTQAVRSILEETCTCDLSDMFNQWVYP